PGRTTFFVPLSPPAHRRPACQPAPLSSYLCLRHDTRRDQPARAHAVDGSHRHPDYPALCADHSARRLLAVCARGGAAPSSPPYRGTARNFLSHLGAAHPELNSLVQLRREPHVLGWMSRLRSQAPPLVTESYINLLIALRATFTELAWTHQLPQLAHLIRREDVPHLPQRLPR